MLPTRRLSQSTLPPRPEHVESIRSLVGDNPKEIRAILARSTLTKNQTLCALDALIASGELDFNERTRIVCRVKSV